MRSENWSRKRQIVNVVLNVLIVVFGAISLIADSYLHKLGLLRLLTIAYAVWLVVKASYDLLRTDWRSVLQGGRIELNGR